MPIHVQADEVPWVERTTGVGAADLVRIAAGSRCRWEDVTVELIHTPRAHAGKPVLPRRRPPRCR